MRGPLPDAAMRKRMVAYMETIPGFATLAAMPWYPGKSFRGVIAQGQAAIRSRGYLAGVTDVIGGSLHCESGCTLSYLHSGHFGFQEGSWICS